MISNWVLQSDSDCKLPVGRPPRQHQLEQSNYCLMLLRPLLVLLFLTSLLLYSPELSFACLMSNLSKSASPGQSKLCHFEPDARRAFARRAVHSNDYSGPLATPY